jgi:magnesium transporter
MTQTHTDKTGLPPGSLIYKGTRKFEKTRITLIEFNENTFTEKEFYNIDECISSTNNDLITWINIDGIHHTEIVEKVGKKFNIHPLTLEDVVNPEQRSKFEEFDNYVVSIMRMPYYDAKVESEQLSIVLSKNIVITFQEIEGADAFDYVRTRLRQGKGRVRKNGADYLFYCLIDAVVDCYFSILEKIDDRLEVLEEELIHDPSKTTLNQLHALKREMIYLRKSVWPMRDMVNNIERTESELITPTTGPFFRDVHDHTIRIIDTVETFRDLLSGMMDIYLSSTSNKMNDIMKLLTIISTIFIPVTFIVGVYGMNFEYMPELRSPYGYGLTWLAMIIIIVGMLIYFRKKKWL